MHVLACATEYRQETAILQRSAKRNGDLEPKRGVVCVPGMEDTLIQGCADFGVSLAQEVLGVVG